MKNVIKIILFIALLITNIEAQNITNNSYDMNSGNSVTTTSGVVQYILNTFSSEKILTTTIIVFELVILMFVLYYWKRSRNETKEKSKKIYKKNINALRCERVKPLTLPNIERKRNSLMYILKTNKLDGRTISKTAKKLAIAKGELFLAARIQQLQSRTIR